MEDPATETLICPVCRSALSACKRISKTNCGHVFCEPCISEHVWRQQYRPVGGYQRQSCPLCRVALGTVYSLTDDDGSAGAKRFMLTIGHVKFEMALRDADSAIRHMLKEAVTSAKFIHRGRRIDLSALSAIVAASPKQETITCLAAHPAFVPTKRFWDQAAQALMTVRDSLTTRLAGPVSWVWGMLAPVWQVAVALVQSASPSYEAPRRVQQPAQHDA